MSELDEQALAIFAKNFSHITASGLLRRSKIKAGLGDEPLVAEDLPAFLLAADAGVRVFAQTPDVYATMRRELAALLPSHSAELDGPEPVPTPLMEPAPALGPAPPASEGEPFEVIEIRSEQDVRRARMRARALAQMAGASTFSVQRLVTAVSELARNIVLYAREGWIELSHQHDPLAIHVRAVDQGAGIANLSEIMAGTYRSKTGMGKGLLGVKKISSNFDIATGPTGTQVTADFAL